MKVDVNQVPKTPKDLHDRLLGLLEEQLEFDRQYWVPLAFSAIIATLGLLTNNSAVVIGAMLIAPLFWPILGVTMGVITTRRRLLERSLIFLLLSVGLVVLVSWAVTIATPIKIVSEEIKLRANPTLLDLFIALASSVIGVLVVSYPQISNSIAGVAISVALLPPLAVVGIGLAFQEWQIFQGALLLFGANMSAIVFSGIATLYFLKVKPRKEMEKTRWRIGMITSALLLLIVAIPLTIYLKETIYEAQMRQEIKNQLEESLAGLYDEAMVNDFQIVFGLGGKQVDIEATVFLPEGGFLTVDQKNQLSDQLTKIVNRSIDLQLNVVDTLVLRRQEDTRLKNLKSQVEKYLTNQLRKIDEDIELVNVILQTKDKENTDLADGELQILVTARKLVDVPFTIEDKQKIEQGLEQALGRDVSLEIDFVSVTRIRSVAAESKLQDQVENILENDLSGMGHEVSLAKVEVSDEQPEESSVILVEAWIWVPTSLRMTNGDLVVMQQDLADQLGKAVRLEVNRWEYDKLKLRPEEYALPNGKVEGEMLNEVVDGS